MKKQLAKWWKYIFFLLLTIFGVTIAVYAFGGSKVRAKTGTSINIDRSQDRYVFKINEKYALDYAPQYKEAGVNLVTYHEAPAYLKLLGKYDIGETLLNGVSQNGDWFYYENPGFREKGQLIALNTKTDEKILKQEPVNEDLNFFPENLKAKGLSQDQSKVLKAENLGRLEELSIPKESAIVMTSAFGFLIVLWLLVLPFAFRKVSQ